MVMKAGQTFVKASGSSGTFFIFTSSLSLIGSSSSPSCSELGCWKMEMLDPWNDVFAVVAVGLWSMLSTAEVVNNFFLKTGGQTTPSSTY